jgi:hypothetical protein
MRASDRAKRTIGGRVAELAIYQESGILVRTLDAERINSYPVATLAKEIR